MNRLTRLFPSLTSSHHNYEKKKTFTSLLIDSFPNHLFSYKHFRNISISSLSNSGIDPIVGVYSEQGSSNESSNDVSFSLTPAAKILDSQLNGSLTAALSANKTPTFIGKTTLILGASSEIPRICVVGLGSLELPKGKNYADVQKGFKDEYIAIAGEEQRKYNFGASKLGLAASVVRKAVAKAALSLKDAGSSSVAVEPFLGGFEAAAIGADLSTRVIDDWKESSSRSSVLSSQLLSLDESSEQGAEGKRYSNGKIDAAAQNFARELAEAPANLLTPTLFSERAVSELKGISGVSVTVRDEDWMREKSMGAFLSVTAGSDQAAKLVEARYTGAPNRVGTIDVALVGKGVTFDTGGISIKPSGGMEAMKADMGGAASVMGAFYGAAKRGLPVNIVALTPLCENMPSGSATKPGDVVTASNGKTIEVVNTDAEGRLILADTLIYADSMKPGVIIDVATLTGAMDVALGYHAIGTFTNSDELWSHLEEAGLTTGDRFWRMPLYPEYKAMMSSKVADLNNTGLRGGGACTAAAFLAEFTGSSTSWAHLDIAGAMEKKANGASDHETPSGMTGKPTRGLIRYLENLRFH